MSNSTNYACAHVRTYEDALQLERQREWHYRQTRRGKFQSRMLSLDMLPADTTQDKYESWISDKGAGAQALQATSEKIIKILFCPIKTGSGRGFYRVHFPVSCPLSV